MTNIRIHDTLSRTKVEFQPIEKDHVRIYVCGPTVYDNSHLGHARTYMGLDILRRIMRDYFKYDVIVSAQFSLK